MEIEMQCPSWKHFLDREAEKPILEGIYVEHGVATDQLRRVPDVLLAITNAFNRVTERNDSTSTLLRYMVNRRKKKDWPRLGNGARKFEAVTDLLTKHELELLRTIYIGLNLASDEYLYRPQQMAQIVKEFFGLSGKHIEGPILVAAIFAKRKRGEWACLNDDQGFGDIAEAVSM